MVAKFLTKSYTTHFCLFGAECFYLKDKQILDNIIFVMQQVKDITKETNLQIALHFIRLWKAKCISGWLYCFINKPVSASELFCLLTSPCEGILGSLELRFTLVIE